MKTIFYAWQSDLPGNTNKNFLEQCLERAIKKANQTRSKAEALVLDKDTQGQAGMPVIAEVIFEKISRCAVFVPDLSFVTPAGATRAISNPNVLIELGYALSAIGDRRIVALFNSAFGETAELPFDLRNRRFPFEYRLDGTESTEARQAARDALVGKLANALAHAADQAPAESDPPEEAGPLHAAAPLDQCTFVPPNSPVIAQVTSRGRDGTDSEHVYWHHGPSAWLRILPVQPLDLSRSGLRAIVEQSRIPLHPFGEAPHSRVCVNSQGVVALGSDHQITETLATRLTQVFRTGELWGLNKELIEVVDPTPSKRFVIPWPETANLFERALLHYLSFAKQTLQLQPPLIVVAGLAMVNDAVFIHRRHGYAEPERSRCMESFIRRQWMIDDLEVSPKRLLTEFYVAVWDACGGLDFVDSSRT
jgi:hypothetical protein